MWREISFANRRGWTWAVGIVVVLAALNFGGGVVAAVIQFKPRPRRRVVGYLPLPDGGCGRFRGHSVHEVVRLWLAAREKGRLLR